MMDILDTDSLLDEYLDVKNLTNKQLVYQNQPIDTQWTNDLESWELIPMGLKTCNGQ